jgi:CO/xanthine dehydrogenase Mo-binding subunit
MHISRREFVKIVTSSGIVLGISHLSTGAEPTFRTRESLPGAAPWNPSATGKGRVDGVAKVTGAKLYASDFRAADLPGWPSTTSHALLLRTPDATHVYMGLDLSRLTAGMRPTVVVTAADVVRMNIRVPAFYADADLFCPVGKTPHYLGQPVALLIFETFDAYDRARVVLRDNAHLKFGRETGPVVAKAYGSNRFTRVAGPDPNGPDVFSPVQAGWATAIRYKKSVAPVWAPAAKHGNANAQASYYGDQIRAELATPGPDVLVLDRTFTTQSNDPMFLEPECGIAWYDTAKKNLEIVVGVQSPGEAAESLAHLLGAAKGGLKPASIDAQFAYIGGGFGGRDHTTVPLYVALAAMFYPGHAVRLAHDRFQQFQAGIKRHAFKMHTQVAFDRKTGLMRAFAADHELDGGGMANFSINVADVGAGAATGIYDAPKVDVTTIAVHSRGVTAGSMRGYGTLQTMTALEVLVNEAAVALAIDPIELRRRNALKTNGRAMFGNPYAGTIRTPEVLDKLAAHPIWTQRAAEKARAQAGFAVGTGVACVIKDYGTGGDCTLSRITIAPDGRIAIDSDAVEMGTAIGTALANRAAMSLGAVATDVSVARVDCYDALALVKTVDPYAIDQKTQDAAARNPRWVPEISSASSASIGAHISTHGANEAARVLFRFGLWPAALDLWGIPASDPRAKQWQDAKWVDGKLTLAQLSPLPQAAIAAKAHARKGVTGAMVHGFNRWEWSKASFLVDGDTWTADIDALALRRGDGQFVRLDRRNVKFPPTTNNRFNTTYTSISGSLVRVEIERATGNLRIAKAYSIVECGTPLVPEVVIGQMQGGFAMGVGYTLLETLPPFEDGPGNGKWNLGQYLVARASDLPMGNLECEILPPLTPTDPPKGMAEVVMIPIVPALLAAIYDATGKRFNALPVTPSMLKGASA